MAEEKKIPIESDETETVKEAAEAEETLPVEESAKDAAESEKEKAEHPEPEETASAAEGKSKKSFFKAGKTEKLEKALKESETKLQEAHDRIQRQMAEFDNFRKRTEKEKAASFEVGARNVIEKLLPVVDSFERGLASLDEADKEEPFETGMLQVYKQLEKILEDLEVKPIEAVGKPFDAELHNAVMHVEDEEQPENTIVEEFQKGYTFRGTVIRYSMVKVAN